MREHILRLIEQASRPGDPIALEGHGDPAIRLAAETIRLARLAASTHMILWARLGSGPDQAAEGRTPA